MSEILHIVEVRGKQSTWLAATYITRKTAQEWREDGLEVHEAVNSIPNWWIDCGLPMGLWCFVQDCFHFKNPWRSR